VSFDWSNGFDFNGLHGDPQVAPEGPHCGVTCESSHEVHLLTV